MRSATEKVLMWPALWNTLKMRGSIPATRLVCLPPHTLSEEIIRAIKANTCKIAVGLKVIGLLNIQYAIKGGKIMVLEVNPRASRTVPFARAIGLPVAKMLPRL